MSSGLSRAISFVLHSMKALKFIYFASILEGGFGHFGLLFI